jgi:UDP-glucose 4-epimerase
LLCFLRSEASTLATQSVGILAPGSGECDLRDSEQVERHLVPCIEEGTSLVFAAGPSRKRGDTWETFQENVTMVHNVARAAADNRLRSVVYLSSSDVYGMPPRMLPVNELTPARPTSHYGLAKLVGETIWHLHLDENVPVTVLRLPGVYGPGDGGRSVVGSFVRRLRAGAPVAISGRGDTHRDFLYVDDLCRIVDRFLTVPYEGMVTVAGGEPCSIRVILQRIAHVLNVPPSFEPRPASAARDHDLTFELTELRRLFPDLRMTALDDGIRRYAAFCEEEEDQRPDET